MNTFNFALLILALVLVILALCLVTYMLKRVYDILQMTVSREVNFLSVRNGAMANIAVSDSKTYEAVKKAQQAMEEVK